MSRQVAIPYHFLPWPSQAVPAPFITSQAKRADGHNVYGLTSKRNMRSSRVPRSQCADALGYEMPSRLCNVPLIWRDGLTLLYIYNRNRTPKSKTRLKEIPSAPRRHPFSMPFHPLYSLPVLPHHKPNTHNE